MSDIYTGNQMMDTLINTTKTLVSKSVIKDTESATDGETLESIRRGDMLIAATEGALNFSIIMYLTEEVLEEAGVPSSMIAKCVADKTLVPTAYRDSIVEIMTTWYPENHIEINNYYRMLNGLPDYGTDGIKIYETITDVDTSQYLHEMSQAELDTLNSLGYIEDLIEEYPTQKYLTFLLNERIDIYTARKAGDFQLLYVPTVSSSSITKLFRSRYEKCRVYTLKRIYNAAYKYGSDYYDAIMSILIKIQAFIDVIANVPELFIKRDLFDIRSIQDLFESNGIEYFESIPRKYQIKMIKNLNSLIKYKSTTKNITLVCSLFGFDDITVFEYYLLKNQKSYGGKFSSEITGDNILLFLSGTYKTREYEYSVDEEGAVILGDAMGDYVGDLEYDIIQSDDLIITNQYGTIDLNDEYNLSISLRTDDDDLIMLFIGGVYMTLGVDYIVSGSTLIGISPYDNWIENAEYDIVDIKNTTYSRFFGNLIDDDIDGMITPGSFDPDKDSMILFVHGLYQSYGVDYTATEDLITNVSIEGWEVGSDYDIIILYNTVVNYQYGTYTNDGNTNTIAITIDDYTYGDDNTGVNYELNFVKVPIGESVDKYVRDDTNYEDYDDITDQDDYWVGEDGDADEIMQSILAEEFNLKKTKYLSIDSLYDMANLSFEIAYFFNMIKSIHGLDDELLVKVRYIDDNYFKLTNLIYYVYALMHESLGVEDTILASNDQVLQVKGFNFEADLTTLEEYVEEQGYTLEDLGASDFNIPDGTIKSFSQLMTIFVDNKGVYDNIVDGMVNADNMKIYRIYKDLYDALMIVEIESSIYELPDGTVAETYTDYLKEYDVTLYNSIVSIRALSDVDKESTITETIGEVLFSLDEYMDTTDFDYLFSNIPSMSTELLKSYVYKVIDFFKSYKSEILGINIVYNFSDRLENTVFINEEIARVQVNVEDHLNNELHYADKMSFTINRDLEDTNDITERISLTATYED